MRNSNHPALPVAPCIASNSLRRFPAWPDWSPKMPFCTCSFTNIMAWCTGQPGHGTDVDWFKQRFQHHAGTLLVSINVVLLSHIPRYSKFQDIPRYSIEPYWSSMHSIDPTWSHLLNSGAAGAAIQSIYASNSWTARSGTFLGTPGFPAQRPGRLGRLVYGKWGLYTWLYSNILFWKWLKSWNSMRVLLLALPNDL